MSLGSRGYSRAINSDAKHDGSDDIVFLSSPLRGLANTGKATIVTIVTIKSPTFLSANCNFFFVAKIIEKQERRGNMGEIEHKGKNASLASLASLLQ